MCRYAYHFHSACRHRSAVPVEYCEKAAPAMAPTFLAHQLQRTASMPAMAPFGGFRQWMAGTATTTTTSTTSAPAQTTLAARRREEGVRGSDESGTLHDSEAVLQHITTSSRSPHDHYIGTDGRRMTSHGSTTAASDAEGPPRPEDLDTIEAEIDTMKAEVQNMRAAQSQQGPAAQETAAAARKPQRTHNEATRIPAPVSSYQGTKMSGSSELSTQDDKTQYAASSIPIMRSYAQPGTSKPKEAITSPSSTSSQSDTQQKYYDAVEYQPGTTSSPDSPATLGDKLEKSSPRFAQPTQATARRVGETLRKDSSPAKSSPEVSPGKTTKAKAPQFETDKRASQRQQKRTSLPEGWMSTPEQPGPAEKSMETEQKSSDNTASSSAEQSQSGKPLRKKTSSYMSPTKAAQHRNVATLGQESPRRMPPRVKAQGLQIDTVIAGKASSNSSKSPLRSGVITSSDDMFFSPRSHLSSNASSKDKSRSPKKAATPQGAVSPLSIESSGSGMKLPMPLPYVPNTVVVRRDSDEDMFDPIKEKLDKEDLLKRDPVQERRSSVARRGSRGEMLLSPVFARLKKVEDNPELADRSIFKNRRPEGYQPERKRSHVHSASSPSFPSMLQGSKDPSNEPISWLITGLRGQSSAEIGKFLAGDPRETSNVLSDSLQGPRPAVDPAIMYQGRKPFGDITSPPQDPAILYQGRKPSDSVAPQIDPEIMSGIGYMDADAVYGTANPRTGYQPNTLRATASDFVPNSAPVYAPEPVFEDEMWWQPDQFQSQSVGHVYENVPMSDAYGMAYPYDDYRSPYATWQGASFERGYHYPSPQQPIAVPNRSRCIMPATITAQTPSISPTSSDTSPPSSKQTSSSGSSRWTIAGRGRRAYLWTGSDGLEIGFKGHGPDAEHDPNSPVLYRNLRAKTNTYHLEAASYPRTHTPGSRTPPDAPKIMRQFAEAMKLPKVPCCDEQWTGKYDSIPVEVPVNGLCPCCKMGDNQLHRIGGGIDMIAQH